MKEETMFKVFQITSSLQVRYHAFTVMIHGVSETLTLQLELHCQMLRVLDRERH